MNHIKLPIQIRETIDIIRARGIMSRYDIVFENKNALINIKEVYKGNYK